MLMLERLNFIKQRFDEVSDLIIQPDIISDQKRYVELNKEYKDLRALMDERENYIKHTQRIEEAEEIIADGSDPEMTEMAKLQQEEAKEEYDITLQDTSDLLPAHAIVLAVAHQLYLVWTQQQWQKLLLLICWIL